MNAVKGRANKSEADVPLLNGFRSAVFFSDVR
jgi:hypothetical protein